MGLAMVSKHLLPQMEEISSVMVKKLLEIKDMVDREEVLTAIALSIINRLIENDAEIACAFAKRIVDCFPSGDDRLQMIRSTALKPEFAGFVSQMSTDDAFNELFATIPRKH